MGRVKGSSNACSEHYRQHKTCPSNCPLRTIEHWNNSNMTHESDDISAFMPPPDLDLRTASVSSRRNSENDPTEFAPINVDNSTPRTPRVIRAQLTPAEEEAQNKRLEKEARKERRKRKSRVVNENRENLNRAIDSFARLDISQVNEVVNRGGYDLNAFNKNYKIDVLNGVQTCFAEMESKFPKLGECRTAEQYFEQEKAFILWMNNWFQILKAEREPKIVMRTSKGERYDYVYLKYGAFKQILQGYRFAGLKKDDYEKCQYYIANPDATFQFKLPTKVARTDEEEEQTVVDPIPHAKFINVADLFIEHPASKKYEGITFNPRPPNFVNAAPTTQLNTWSGFRLSREDVKPFTDWSKIKLLLNHIRYTWCDNNEEFAWIMYKLAILLQKPWFKQQSGWLLAGPEGAGKSFFFESVLGKIIGTSHYVGVHSESEIVGEYNAILRHKIAVFFDEVGISGDGGKKAMSQIKLLHTARTQRVRKMYEDTMMEDSYIGLICYATNEIDKIFCGINAKSRRVSMFWCDPMPLLLRPEYLKLFDGDDKKYFKYLVKTLDDPKEVAVKTFANFLYNLRVPEDFDCTKPIMTALLANQIEKQLRPLEAWWKYCIEMKENVIVDPLKKTTGFLASATLSQLYHHFDVWCTKNKKTHAYSSPGAMYGEFSQIIPKDVTKSAVGSGDFIFTFINNPRLNEVGDVTSSQIREWSVKSWKHLMDFNEGLKKNSELEGNWEGQKRLRINKIPHERNLLALPTWMPKLENLRTNNPIGPKVVDNFVPFDDERMGIENDEEMQAVSNQLDLFDK